MATTESGEQMASTPPGTSTYKCDEPSLPPTFELAYGPSPVVLPSHCSFRNNNTNDVRYANGASDAQTEHLVPMLAVPSTSNENLNLYQLGPEPNRTPPHPQPPPLHHLPHHLHQQQLQQPPQLTTAPTSYHNTSGGHAAPTGSNESLSNNSASSTTGSQHCADAVPPDTTPKKSDHKTNGNLTSQHALHTTSASTTPNPNPAPKPASIRKRKQNTAENKTKHSRMERKVTDYFKTERTPKHSKETPGGSPYHDAYANGGASTPTSVNGRTPFRKRSLSQDSRDKLAANPSSAATTAASLNPASGNNDGCECKVESTSDPASSPSTSQTEMQLKRLTDEVHRCQCDLQNERRRVGQYKDVIRQLLIEKSKAARKEAREKNLEAQLRIGQFRPTRVGEHFKDQWTDGYAMEEINTKLEKLNQEKNEIQNMSGNLRKRKGAKDTKRVLNEPASPSVSSSQAQSDLNPRHTLAPLDDGTFLRPETPKEMTSQEIYEQEEILKLRREHLKREELELLTEKDRLERERNLHIREMKRIQCEEQSRFKNHALLNDRYLLMSLLGKGGFSEVWRAYDLDENRYVACKIHHVNKEWKEDKKANYVKHAMREKDIHKSLHHPRIVQLFDLFTIDNDSFCTVLEYCDGNDLDFYLKQHKQIPEKEARSIIMQVVSALKYLNERKHPIIHYDLKPANILLQSGTAGGEIKITDFGLSKTMENSDDGESIELTSQGAGTYWYLPPETFQSYSHGYTPKINSKVDVWSVGVIFYQCLYGKRPFGHERTQQQILQEKTILNASEVSFPPNPRVSAVAQDFIRSCLQYRKEERADVVQLHQHELFRPKAARNATC